MEQVPKIPIHRGHGIAKLEFSEKHQSHRCWPLQGYPNNIATEPSIFDASPSLCQEQGHFNYASRTSQERAGSLLRDLRRGSVQQPFRERKRQALCSSLF